MLRMGLQEAVGSFHLWVGFACRTASMVLSDRSQDRGKTCSWIRIFGCSFESCTGVCLPHCCAPWRVRWESLIQQGGSTGGAETRQQRPTPNTAQMSSWLSFKAVLSKASGPLIRVFRWVEVAFECFVWSLGPVNPYISERGGTQTHILEDLVVIDAAEKHYPKHFPHDLGNQRHFELLWDKWETLISRCFSRRDSDMSFYQQSSCGVSLLSSDRITWAGGNFARIHVSLLFSAYWS